MSKLSEIAARSTLTRNQIEADIAAGLAVRPRRTRIDAPLDFSPRYVHETNCLVWDCGICNCTRPGYPAPIERIRP